MSERKSKISRRAFLALTGGTGAGLVVNQGERLVHKLIPYVNPPDYPPPGTWAFYATACRECPAGCGMITWHRDGRSTKAEGNPNNPVNKGKLCIRGQSSVQGEYDPDRLKEVLQKNEEGKFIQSNWNSAYEDIRSTLNNSPVAVISDVQTGSLAEVMDSFTSEYNGNLLYYEAFNYESLRKANAETYGKNSIPRYSIQDSDLIISFGADFLETWLSPVEYARHFANLRDPENGSMSRFIHFGPSESLTAANADDFIITTPGTEAEIISRIIGELTRKGTIENTGQPVENTKLNGSIDEKKIEKVAQLIADARSPVILAGSPGDFSVEGTNTVKAANLLNELLGNRHKTDFSKYHALSKTAFRSETIEFFESLTPEHTLIIHNTNPVYSLNHIEEHIERAGKVIFIGSLHNESADFADWILPSFYPLEDWGDYEAWKGTITLMQPTMAPLYNIKSSGDIFLELSRQKSDKPFRDIVRENWQRWNAGISVDIQDENEVSVETEQTGKADSSFQKLLQLGYISTNADPEEVSFNKPQFTFGRSGKPENDALYLQVSPSLFFYDGKLANRPWLQEIPHPMHGIVWQSWMNMHPDKAADLDLDSGDSVILKANGSEIEVPVFITDQIDKNTVAIECGQGHHSLGHVANNVGVNAFRLLENTGSSFPTVYFNGSGGKSEIVSLIGSAEQYDRELLMHVELEELHNKTAVKEEITWPGPEGYHKDRDLYEPHDHEDHRWAMVIDLNRCIGCKACESACYAENNIPVLGRENMKEGREMSWLKIIPYFINEKQRAFLPVPCQHCDAAPCEPVCPVYAAVHNEEGLNAQIYNRCIGTRYCSNNCPYKVRRFNWVNVDHDYPSNLQLNPEVTVRSRGVMEKCTFCVQRIRNKEYEAKKENRKIEDHEIQTACQQTCPTNAIVFGDLHDENSEVYKLMDHDRRYQLLHELNTKTAVIYLKKVINKG